MRIFVGIFFFEGGEGETVQSCCAIKMLLVQGRVLKQLREAEIL